MSSYPTDARPSPPSGADGERGSAEDDQLAPAENDPVPDPSAALPADDETTGRSTDADAPSPGDDPAASSTDLDPNPGGVADDVAADLAGLRDSPVEDHPDVYQGVHDRLRATLSGIDNL